MKKKYPHLYHLLIKDIQEIDFTKTKFCVTQKDVLFFYDITLKLIIQSYKYICKSSKNKLSEVLFCFKNYTYNLF